MSTIEKIKTLGQVLLCGNRGSVAFEGNSTRSAFNSALGRLTLDYWSGQNKLNHNLIFKEEIARFNATDACDLLVTQVWDEMFANGFGATIKNEGLSGLIKKVSLSVVKAMKEDRAVRPACPGFRDVVLHLPPDDSARGGFMSKFNTDFSNKDFEISVIPNIKENLKVDISKNQSKSADDEYAILSITIGTAFMDFLNGYQVGNIAPGYVLNGGANSAIFKALDYTFRDGFEVLMQRRGTLSANSGDNKESIGKQFFDNLKKVASDDPSLFDKSTPLGDLLFSSNN